MLGGHVGLVCMEDMLGWRARKICHHAIAGRKWSEKSRLVKAYMEDVLGVLVIRHVGVSCGGYARLVSMEDRLSWCAWNSPGRCCLEDILGGYVRSVLLGEFAMLVCWRIHYVCLLLCCSRRIILL